MEFDTLHHQECVQSSEESWEEVLTAHNGAHRESLNREMKLPQSLDNQTSTSQQGITASG